MNCATDGPTASFTVSDDGACGFTFTDTSTAGTSSIVSWDWDFGDTNTSTSQNPTHTYGSQGEYTVELTVTDANGCTDVVTVDVSCCITCDDGLPDTVIVTASSFAKINPGACNPSAFNAAVVLDRISPCSWEARWTANGCCNKVGLTISTTGIGVAYNLCGAGCFDCVPDGVNAFGLVATYSVSRTDGDSCQGTYSGISKTYADGKWSSPATVDVEI